jgi:very-short-patch-repair endonuclease
VILASEAVTNGDLTYRELARRYTKVFPNVYAPKGTPLTAADRTWAAWLASGRRAVMVGQSAAVLHGSRWVPAGAPAERLGDHYRRASGIIVHSGLVPTHEICQVGEIRCTTVERTAYDLGRRLAFVDGLIRVDALLNATGAAVTDVASVAEHNKGARGIRRLRRVLDVADAGAESPQETRVRLILVCGGLPRPQSQISVGWRRLDLGWPEWKVGVEYDGIQHWQDPTQHGGDIARLEFFDEMGWRIVRVVAEHVRTDPQGIVDRAAKALWSAGWRGEKKILPTPFWAFAERTFFSAQ